MFFVKEKKHFTMLLMFCHQWVYRIYYCLNCVNDSLIGLRRCLPYATLFVKRTIEDPSNAFNIVIAVLFINAGVNWLV